MKRNLLTALIVIFIFSTGCNRYDYRKDAPTGYYNYDDLLQDDSINLNNYDGSYSIAQTNLLTNYNSTYSDNNIAIIAGEERYTKCVLTVFVYSICYFENFKITVNYYDEEGTIIETVTSDPQVALGNCYNSIIINKPNEYASVEIVSYSGDNKGTIKAIEYYDFKKGGLIEQKSNTTYKVLDSDEFIVFLTEDGRVVYGTDGLQNGTFIIGRNYIKKYAIVRGE